MRHAKEDIEGQGKEEGYHPEILSNLLNYKYFIGAIVFVFVTTTILILVLWRP